VILVYWSHKARIRLREIHAYIAKDSPLSATHMVDRLTRRGANLAAEPRIDRRVPEYPEDELREVLERPYRLIFQVSPGRIDILTIKHYRQRLPEQPADL
jgi:plasmid stabilization system protein ParE